MATTNLNTLSLQHAKNIADPPMVQTADQDGKRWTSAQRTYHINEAIRRWIRKVYRSAMAKERRGAPAEKEWQDLGTYLSVATDTLSGKTLTLDDWGSANEDVAWIVSVYNSSTGHVVKKIPQSIIPYTTTTNSFLAYDTNNAYWYLDGRTFTMLGGGSNNTINLTFVKQHTDLTVVTGAGGTDIELPSHVWDQILDLAFKVAMEEVGDSESAAKGLIKEQIVDGEIA